MAEQLDNYSAIEEFAERFNAAPDDERLKILRESGAQSLPDSSIRRAVETLARLIPDKVAAGR